MFLTFFESAGVDEMRVIPISPGKKNRKRNFSGKTFSNGTLKMPEERRQYRRFRGKEGAFAAFLRSGNLVCLGNIIDISMSGLCVRYLSTRDEDCDFTEIKVFGSNGRFIHVDRMDCKIIYSFEIPEGSLDNLSTKRCGVRFENLNVRHMTLLQDFIEHFTNGEDFH